MSGGDTNDEQFLEDFSLDRMPEPTPRSDLDDPRTGFFPDMDAETYFGDPIEEGSLSNSGIGILLGETPLEFAVGHPRLNPDAVDKVIDTVAARRGDVVHQLVLGKGKGYAIGDFPDWRTKAAGEFKKDAIKAGETPVLKHQFENALVIAEVVRERLKVALDGAAYQTEVTVICREDTDHGAIYLRGRLDIWCEELLTIIDPKISAIIHNGPPGAERVQRHAVSMGWDRQGGIYRRIVERLMPAAEGRVRFANLLVKPEPPFTSRLLWHSRTMTRTALFQARPAVNRFAECLRTGRWPSYPPEGEEFELPSWEERRRLAEENGELP